MHEWRDALGRLRERDRDLRAFGVSSHRYELRPPLGEAAVAAFEGRYGVQLPAAYRSFVCDVGDGDAGPGYGLFPLGVRDERTIGDDIGEDDFPLLATPFDEASAFAVTLADVDEDDDDAVEAAYADYYDRGWSAGAMFLNHYGCALRAMLVVTGPLAGRVVVDQRAEQGGIVPFDHACARRFHNDEADNVPSGPFTFDAWYESWLRGLSNA